MIKREELSNPASCMGRAKNDEMTFVLLGRDAAAPVAIRAWVTERIRLGKNTAVDEQVREALACAWQMERDPKPRCSHERLNEDGICRKCGVDRRGIDA